MVRERLSTLLHPTPFKAGILCIGICCLLWYSFGYEKPPLLTAIDARIVDAMFRIRGPQETTGSVIIIDIDEKSLKEYGQWPWPRSLVAQLTAIIYDARANVVGFDILFAETDRTSPSGLFHLYRELLPECSDVDLLLEKIRSTPQLDFDRLFGEVIGQGKAVLGYSFLLRDDSLKDPGIAPFPSLNISLSSRDVDFQDLKLIRAYRPVLNIPEIANGASEGFFNVFPDANGTIRKVPLFMMMDSIPYPSLAFEMVRLGWGEQEAVLHPSTIGTGKYRPLAGVSLGRKFFRTDANGQLTVNFRGPFNTFLYLSASDILKGADTSILENKYVLIGSSASGIMDLVATPFSARLPGVEVHANVIDNLLNDDILVWENYTEIGLTFFFIIVGGLLIVLALVFLGPFAGFTVGIGIILAIVAGNYYFLFLKQQLLGLSFILISLFSLFITVTFSNYFFEGRKRLFIRRAFSQYVAPSVVNQLLKNPQKLNISAETREVTVLFCDIRNFTTLSEEASASELSVFLNDYFSLLTEVIIKNNGMVDKYIGDAIMAVWGTPLDDPNHAANAMRTAMEMIATVHRNSQRLRLAGQGIEIGIGINTGAVSAGNFGSSDRFDYTVLGDNVNLASRIEGLTKYYQLQVLLSKSTKDAAALPLDYMFVDTVLVKGRNRPADLYTPSDLYDVGVDRNIYNKAIRYYKEGEFVQALEAFESLQAETPTKLFDIYIKRCLKLISTPPPSDWQAVFHHT